MSQLATGTSTPPLHGNDVAKKLDCHPTTIRNKQKQRKLFPVDADEYKGRVVNRKYSAEAVSGMEPLFRRQRDLHTQGFSDTEEGRRYTLEKAAEKHGLPVSLLKRAVKKVDPELYP